MWYRLKARTEPSPTKTKMQVEKNSAMVALMESGLLASFLPNSYLLVVAIITQKICCDPDQVIGITQFTTLLFLHIHTRVYIICNLIL